MRVTDRRTDRQNYDPQDRASIAASRSNYIKRKQLLFFVSFWNSVCFADQHMALSEGGRTAHSTPISSYC